MKKHIPNIITSLNLLSGCIAILFVVSGDLVVASFLVLLGMFLDFFDGLAARLLHVQSDVGLQLDSLADMVSFGVVPGLMMFQLLNKATTPHLLETGFETSESMNWFGDSISFLPFLGLLIILSSAYRLAKFNVDTRQTSSFIGLPTPAITLLIISLPLMYQFQYYEVMEGVIFNKWFLIVLTLLSSYLLNAEIHLFALKFKTWDFASNRVRYIFLGISLLLLLVFKFIAIPVILILYILFSVFQKDKISS
ncbi:MAG: CDP-alcohol phosphatidyltransferase family protein [Flavobacteriaceae bacterium]